MWFAVVNGFTQLRSTGIYSAIAYLYSSQITTALVKPFPTYWVITIHSLATASNGGDSSASRAHVLSSQPPMQNSTELTGSHSYLLDNPSA
jgi:hypothetical protein